MASQDDVRRFAMALPETVEKPFYGTAGYWVQGRGFLRLRTEAEGGLVVFVESVEEKEALLASNPEAFFTTPHYDGHAAVLVNLEAVDLEELNELIIESWRLKAKKRVREAFDRER